MAGFGRHRIGVALVAVVVTALLAGCSSAANSSNTKKSGTPAAGASSSADQVAPASSSPNPPVSTSAPSGTSGQVSGASHAAVNVGDSGFEPASVTIKAGAIVAWLNKGKKPHTLLFDSGLTSGEIAPGKNAAHKFLSPGRFAYHDQASSKITGVIIVK